MQCEQLKKSRIVLACVLLAAVTLAAYWPVRLNDFVNFDDPLYVTENPQVQAGLTWAGLGWAFGELHGEQTYWHPLTWVSHMVDCQVFGPKPAGHHLVNLLFHTLNTVLVFLVFRRLTGAFWRCAVLAALFALHPLQVDTVAWVAERKNVLSTCFWLLTMWAYACYTAKSKVQSLKSKVRGGPATQHASRFTFHVSPFHLLSLLLFALGLMCKPVLVTLPFVLLLLDYWPLRRLELASADASVQGSRFKVQGSKVLRLLVEKLPFLVLAGASSVITILAHRGLGGLTSASILPLDARIENAVVSYVRYLGKTVWPSHLAVFYPYGSAWPMGIVVACALFLLALTLLALGARRTRPYLLVGWFWFLGVLVPFIGLVQGGSQALADRFAYVPLLGLFLALVWGTHEFAARRRLKLAALSAAAVMAVGVCFALTRNQLRYWQDSETLFRHALSVTTGNYVAHANLGNALASRGKLQEAEAEFSASLRLQPVNYSVTYALANLVRTNRSPEAALELFRKALALRPQDATAHYNHAIVLAELGQEDGAIAHYREALRLDPKLAPAHNNLAGLLLLQGKSAEGLAHALTALRLQPDFPEAHFNAGNGLFLQEKFTEAEAHYRAALKLNPNLTAAHLHLGEALVNQEKLQAALEPLATAARLEPGNPRPLQDLAEVNLAQKRPREALENFRAALRLAPDWVEGMNKLAWILATQPDPKLRDGAQAIELAARASALTGGTNMAVQATLAAAYAEAGMFKEAVDAQQWVCLLTVSQRGAEDGAARDRIEQYRAGRPFRER